MGQLPQFTKVLKAMSRAMERLSQQIVGEVYQAIQKRVTSKTKKKE